MSDSVPGDRPVICVFGSYSPKPGEPLWESAWALGQALAAAGYTVANGGYDGTMLASAQGAKAAGGATIGVTCEVFNNYRGERMQANAYIDREIGAEDLLCRIRTMMDLADGYVAMDGGTGTLLELACVWEFVCKGLTRPRPIIAYGEFWRPLVERIACVRPKHAACIHLADSPAGVVEILAQELNRRGPGGVGSQEAGEGR